MHLLHDFSSQVTEHTYKGWLATIFLGVIGKLMIFMDLPIEAIHYAQFAMYILACIVSVMTAWSWIEKKVIKTRRLKKLKK